MSRFRELIDAYRRKADEQVADADELSSGRWRFGNQDGDQSEPTASSKRGNEKGHQ